MGKSNRKELVKKANKFLSVGLLTAMVVVSVPNVGADAAAAPKLNKKKVSVQVGNKYTLKVKNKIKGSTYTWKSSKKAVATVTKKGVVKGKKKGNAVITCTVKAPAKTYKLTANVKVKKATTTPTTTPTPTKTPEVNTSATVSTQSELETALSNSDITAILVKTDAEAKFNIPAGTYTTKKLTVNAPKADVVNAGIFKDVNVQDIKDSTWTENAKGNTLNVTDTTANIVVSANAEVKEMIIAGSSANVGLKVDGILSKLTLNKKAKVEVTGTATKAIPVEVASDAANAEIISVLPVQVTLNATATITLNKGAENSKVEKKSDSVAVTVDNKTTTSITITTPTGTQTVTAGSKATNASKDGTTPTTTPNSGGSNNGGSSADTDNNNNNNNNVTGAALTATVTAKTASGSGLTIEGNTVSIDKTVISPSAVTVTVTLKGEKLTPDSSVECTATNNAKVPTVGGNVESNGNLNTTVNITDLSDDLTTTGITYTFTVSGKTAEVIIKAKN